MGRKKRQPQEFTEEKNISPLHASIISLSGFNFLEFFGIVQVMEQK